jgi:hypothetical protein
MENNPLSAYFRRPSIYIKLPSSGNYYPPGTIDKTVNGEYPVFPMTAVDEISYRTPDALFNGQAAVDVIQSCVPNIKNAWAVPSLDLDAILVAIRIASYGHSMDIDTTCPSCSEESTYSLDLRTVMENLKTPKFNEPLLVGDLEIHFKPLSYKQVTDNNILQFEEQKLMTVIQDAEMDEKQKLAAISEAFKKVSELTLKAVRQGVFFIKTPDAEVSEPQYIDEFLKNCERTVFDRIKERIIGLKAESELKPLSIKCSSCGFEYKQPFTLDMTNFFG